MTTFAPPVAATGAGTAVTLVGELIEQSPSHTESPDRATLSVRWLGVTVQPTHDTEPGPTPTPGPQPETETTATPRGLRGLTAGIRRLVDGPPGRHRAGRPTT